MFYVITVASSTRLVTVLESKRFIIDCFTASRTSEAHAKEMADLLVEADYRGHFSHGMNRLEMYINDLHRNTCDGMVKPTILNDTPATAWVDGNNGLGAVVGNFCMDLAMEKARKVGVGVVSAKGSNHYGIAGWYTIRAQKNGLIGFSMTNTSPLMTPTRSNTAALGTNPISFAAPANDDDSFVLDMATTAVAVGKIEMKRRTNEPCPLGWAQDSQGRPLTDPHEAFDASRLLPLGGSEETSGFKGYGLGAMVDILCGVLAGGNYSTHIRHWLLDGADERPNLGQFFMALNPACFAPGFTDRVSDLNGILRNMPRVSRFFIVSFFIILNVNCIIAD